MKCIIVHGCPSNKEKAMDPEKRTYDKHWMPWLKRELEKKGIETVIPLMPEPWSPIYEDWKKKFNGFEFNEKDVLIGHSCGGGFLVRYLGDSTKKVGKLILVAPAIMHSGDYQPLKDMLQFKIDLKIRDLVNEIVIFVSEDDSKGILKSVEIFEKALDAKVVRFKNKGHFTLGDMGREEFPELLEEVLR